MFSIKRRQWTFVSVFTALTMLLSMVLTGIAAPMTAFGAEGEQSKANYLDIKKGVTKSDLGPGEEFTYTIHATCSQVDCVNGSIFDQLPKELAGFELVSTAIAPANEPVQVTWTVDGQVQEAAPANVTANTSIQVLAKQELDLNGGFGIVNGTVLGLNLTLKVPANYPPGTSGTITNTAVAKADNSADDTDYADIVISSPVIVEVETTKQWEPSGQTFKPGQKSTISVGVKNISNVNVEKLVLEEPSTPLSGNDLSPANPFNAVDFAGFGSVAIPDGATGVQVDALVKTATGWDWVAGVPNATGALELPSSLPADAEIGGTRITAIGDFEPDAQFTYDFEVAQRTQDRAGKDLSGETTNVVNKVTGSVTHEGESKTADANANFEIKPSQASVAVTKAFDPTRIPAGDKSSVTIKATNGPELVKALTITDTPGFFTDDLTFAGWTNGPTWPAGATAAKITYAFLDPTADPASEDFEFADGASPTGPTKPISGFKIEFTGDIEAEAGSTLSFDVQSVEDLDNDSRTKTNTVESEVTPEFGLAGTATDSANLELITPGIELELDKTVRPGATVRPGQSVAVGLQANASKSTDNTVLNEIVIEDVLGTGDSEFWDAFNLKSVAPTQIPANADLTVEVLVDGAWVPVLEKSTGADAEIFSLSQADLNAAIGNGKSVVDVTGIKFNFVSKVDAGFNAPLTVRPTIMFDARGELRNGTTPAADTETVYTNAATTNASGTSPNDEPLTASDGATGKATVKWTASGPGELGITKKWNKTPLSSLTGDQAQTKLSWAVGAGFESVSISDPADPKADPVGTVFDAFNLVEINPIPASDDAFTNGWYLKYDTITEVAIYVAGERQILDAPNGSWQNDEGGFKGYSLTGPQQESVTGVDIVLLENTAARVAAAQAGGSFDAYAPEVGSGVTTTVGNREFDLTWQLRNQTRTSEAWITADTVLNVGVDSEGVVKNTTQITGIVEEKKSSATASDNIAIVNQPPLVGVVKTVDSKTAIYTPPVGSPDSAYATPTWTIVAKNGATTPAAFVRVTDPLTCDDGSALAECSTDHSVAGATDNPFAAFEAMNEADSQTWVSKSMFDEFTATGISFSASLANQVDLSESVVWILKYDAIAKKFSTQKTTAAEVNSNPGSVDWADVVGVSVTYQKDGESPTITQDNNLELKIKTVLRKTYRASAKPLVLSAPKSGPVENHVYAQSYLPILGEGKGNGADSRAQVTLTGGIFEVTATKTISPKEIARPTKDVPVTVSLGATSGTSTLSPQKVVIEDHQGSDEFWGMFDFAGIASVTAPAGADLVQVDVFGQFEGQDAADWKLGTARAVAELPISEAEFSKVSGIRVTFTKTGGGLFVPSPEKGKWDASLKFTAQLREFVRDTTDPVEFTGDYKNVQTTTSSRDDQTPATANAQDSINLSEGSQKLLVQKIANNGYPTVGIGQKVPFQLIFKNNGTGYLNIDEVVDQLPAELVWLGDEPVFSTSENGTLGTEGITVAETEQDDLVFTWPQGQNVMQPGETFTITVRLELQPLPKGQDQAVNTMVVHTEQPLQACGHLTGQNKLTKDWADDEGKNSCGAFDHVQPQPGPNLFVVKGVRHLDEDGTHTGAYRYGAEAAACATPTLKTTEGNFFRSPCITHSEIDATDDWVLFLQNAGTEAVTQMVIFDQLPIEDDQLLVDGKNRGSKYRPQLIKEPTIVAPQGVTFTSEVSYSTSVCNNTWNGLRTQEACTTGNEAWEKQNDDTDWTKVTGLRMTADFTQAAGKEFSPGEYIEVHYSSKNVLSNTTDETGASRVVPAGDQVAINQFGVQFKYTSTKANAFERISPNIVGVDLQTGSLEVQKVIAGAAKANAPEVFSANVTCAHGETALDLGDSAIVDLTKDNDFTARIDGIPLGAKCEISEQGGEGSYGETSRSIANETINIDVPNAVGTPVSQQAVPETQTTTLTNTYEFGGFDLAKVVDTAASVGTFGPFEFDLMCTHLDKTVFKETVTLSGPDNLTYAAPENAIPVGSDCLITETKTGNADLITIAGAEQVLDEDEAPLPGHGQLTIEKLDTPVTVTVTDSFNSGTLAVTKAVDGQGSDRFGDGIFTVAAECMYNEETIYTGEVSFKAGESKTFLQNGAPVVLPNGTQCDLAETHKGGANDTEFGGEDQEFPARIIIKGAETSTEIATNEFDIVNIFNVGNLVIRKIEAGDGADRFGGNDYTVRLECTYDVDGTDTKVLWDGQDYLDVTLTKESGYRHIETGILQDADCSIVAEPATGGSHAQDLGTKVEIIANGETEEPAEISVTNTFNVGDVAVLKVEDGAGVDRFGGNDYTVRLECTYDVDGTDTKVLWDDQDYLDVTLTKESGYRHVEGGITEGAECVITEESITGGSNEQDLGNKIIVVNAEETSEPQEITVTNTFNVGSVVVTKVEDGGGADRFGGQDYLVRLECTYDLDGVTTPITWDDEEFVDLALTPENGYQSTVDNLIVGADCRVIEELVTGGSHDQDLGESVVVVADSESAQAAQITVTNTFDVGEIEVNKVIAGLGGDRFGNTDYTVRLECTYLVEEEVQTVLWDENPWLDLELSSENDYRVVVTELLVGTECAVTQESVTGGANEVDLGAGVVVADTADHYAVLPSIEVTNTFNVGSLAVHKVLAGSGAQENSDKTFTVRLECVYDADGTDTKVLWGEDEYLDIDLNKANNFSAEIDQILSGSECAVIKETESGGAAKVDLGSAVLVISGADEVPVITVTNSFDALATTGTSAVLPTALALVLLAGGAFMMRTTRKTGQRRA